MIEKENRSVDKTITKVGMLSVGAIVIVDGAVCKIDGFKNRNTVFVTNLNADGGNSEWWTGKLSVRDLVPVRMMEDVRRDSMVTDAEIMASALQDGLRRMGLVATVTLVSADDSSSKADVIMLAERPSLYSKVRFEFGG